MKLTIQQMMPVQHQAILMLLNRPLATHFFEILIKVLTFLFLKMRLKM